MTADIRALRRSPLGADSRVPGDLAAADGITLREAPFLAQILVRLDPTAAALAALEAATGIRLPTTPNCTDTSPGMTTAHWLAPDEWLVVAEAEPPVLLLRLQAPVEAHGGCLVDVSAHRTALALRGPRAVEILASGCSVDLDPRAFPVGACVQTQLARVDVILVRIDADEIGVLVRASFARYLVDWLKDAIGADERGPS